jgi:Na+/phosphate symporter
LTELSKCFKQVQQVVRRYTIGNWGFPFIGGFIVLLFTAAVLLVAGLSSVAEVAATCAYLALAVGVVLQLICLGKNRVKNGGVLHGSG